MSAFSALLAIVSAFATASPPGPPRPEPPDLTRIVEYSEDLECREGSETSQIEGISVRIPVPRTDHSQWVRSMRFIDPPANFESDDYGNLYAVFRRSVLKRGERWTVGYSCLASTWRFEARPDPGSLLPLDQVPDSIRRLYLKDGTRYQIEDESLRKAAAGIAATAENSLELAFAINEFLRERLRYMNDGRWDAAPKVLENGHGSCSEYTFLGIALARIHGLPARYVGSTALRRNSAVYVDTVHHRWMEFYLPGFGWFPVDGSRNDGEDGNPVNAHFGRTAPDLLVLMRGDGGDRAPLGWGYVTRASTERRTSGARLHSERRFTWRRQQAP